MADEDRERQGEREARCSNHVVPARIDEACERRRGFNGEGEGEGDGDERASRGARRKDGESEGKDWVVSTEYV